ncbi:MAG: hypothetical protein JKY88_01735 [Pseudomonadales bacterium]|nr:hypothetical protein [Pseudomonadales bacterium]
MIEVIANNFWAISGSILLACFTAWLAWNHFLEVRRINASDKFRSIVLAELKEYYPIPTSWPEHSFDISYILREKFPALNEAVEEYSHFVKDKSGFLSSWDTYRYGEKDTATGQQDYFQYTGAYLDNEKPPNPQEVLKENIARLLSYCEQT